MFVHPAPTAPTHELPGARFTSLATPTTGSTDTAVWKVELAPGHPPTPHRLTRQEVFVALAGQAIASLDGTACVVGPGDSLVVRAGAVFALTAVGQEDFVAVCCMPVGGQAVLDGAEPFTPPWAL